MSRRSAPLHILSRVGGDAGLSEACASVLKNGAGGRRHGEAGGKPLENRAGGEKKRLTPRNHRRIMRNHFSASVELRGHHRYRITSTSRRKYNILALGGI